MSAQRPPGNVPEERDAKHQQANSEVRGPALAPGKLAPCRLIVPFPDSKSDIAGVCPTSTQEIEVTAAPPVKGAKTIRIRIKFCLGPLAFEVWVLADLMSRHGRLHSQESTVRLHHRINTGTSDIDRIVT